MKVAASFLTSKNKAKDLAKLNLTTIDYIHVDFMDGKFVKQKSLPFRELKKVYKYTSKRLDVHLMAKKPAKLIKKFASLNTEFITIHLEIEEDIHKLIKLIHKYGIKAGLCIKPNTDINLLKDYLDEIEMILVMGVEPGMGGQAFIKETENRLRTVRNMLSALGKSHIMINVDGGINDETIRFVEDYVDIVVSGSYITNSNDFQKSIDSLKGIIKKEISNPLELRDKLENINQPEDEKKDDFVLNIKY